jgi:hypothetical protein
MAAKHGRNVLFCIPTRNKCILMSLCHHSCVCRSDHDPCPDAWKDRPESWASLKQIGYTRSCLACRMGHLVPIWQPLIGSSFAPPGKVDLGVPRLTTCLLLR